MNRTAKTGDGKEIDPRAGVVPIMKEMEPGKLKIVGTGFYVTRYGLFLTAQHVMSDLTTSKPKELGVGYIIHSLDENEVHMRRIRSCSLLQTADLALGQAENFMDKFLDAPLMNLRSILTTEVPRTGSGLITYAYPENEILDFTQSERAPVVSSDYFEGSFLGHISAGERSPMPYAHFDTDIEIRSGASGGPVFDEGGRVIGVNCRGWDFGGAEHEGDNLSSIVPIVEALPMLLPSLQLPKKSWELGQIPVSERSSNLTLKDLAKFGHVKFDPKLVDSGEVE